MRNKLAGIRIIKFNKTIKKTNKKHINKIE